MLDGWQYKVVVFSVSRIHFNKDFPEQIQQKSNSHNRKLTKFPILHALLYEQIKKLQNKSQLP